MQNVASETTEYSANRGMAFADLFQGIKNYRLWHYLAMLEMRRRYRRTVIGPFWATLSIGFFILCMGVVLSGLWGNNTKEFLPYFSAGYISWILISSLITEGCNTFISNELYLKQLSVPYILYALLVTWRNFITFAHHLVIFVLVLLFCQHPINANILWFIPGLVINFVAGVWVCLLLGMLCVRYRDVQQIIASMLQLAMFVTPIMWKPAQLGAKGVLITQFNPLFHYISILRLPLLGVAPTAENWAISLLLTALLMIVTFELFTKKYRTLIYWL